MNADNRLVFLTNVRLSYPNLAAPQKMRNDDGTERVSYGASFLLEPGDPQWQKFIARCTELATEHWKEHAQAVLQRIYGDRKSRCFSQGEEHIDNRSMQVRGGYAGKVVITCRGDRQPQAIDLSGAPVDPTNSMQVQAVLRKLYGGCRVNAAVKPWVQQNKHGAGIRCDLVAIQFCKDDTPFGEAAPDVAGMFGAVEQPQAPAMGAPAPQMPAVPFGNVAAPAAAPAFGGPPQMPAFPGMR